MDIKTMRLTMQNVIRDDNNLSMDSVTMQLTMLLFIGVHIFIII